MTIEPVSATDVGSEPIHNEDAVYTGVIGGTRLLAVADGMGGYRAGDVASENALETFVSHLEEQVGETGRGSVVEEDILVESVLEANDRVYELAASDPELEGMGTTLVAATIHDGLATLVNVGDSRAYHVTEDRIEQMTTDQSMVQELLEEGTITPEEAADHPLNNVVSEALGTEPSVEPDTYRRTIEGVVLVCSDGLSDEVPESDIHDIVTSAGSFDEATDLLIERANEVDGSDNVSVVLGR